VNVNVREFEEQLLGKLLHDPSWVAKLEFSSNMLTSNANRAVFVAIADAHFNSAGDVTTAVVEALGDRLEECGGVQYLLRLIENAQLSVKPTFEAEYLTKEYEKRKATAEIQELVDGLSRGDDPTDMLRDTFDRWQQRDTPSKRSGPVAFSSLAAEYPRLDEPIIDGLARRAEVGNIISSTKVGKSWMMLNVTAAAITGGMLLGQFSFQRPRRVLLIDNELRPATIVSRAHTVFRKLEILPAVYEKAFSVWSLRGRLLDIRGIARALEGTPAGRYDVVVCDAWYRCLPDGVSENANNEITSMYNLVERLADRLDCFWINVHHASKGNQSDKAVTDVGSGAGSQARAADTHIVLRPHEEAGAFVMEAEVRSFPRPEPVTLRWEFPLWVPDGSLDPSKLAGRMTKQEKRQRERDAEGLDLLRSTLHDEGGATVRILRQKTGLSRERCQRLLDQLEASGEVTGEAVIVRGNECRTYRLLTDVGDETAHVSRPRDNVA
jgi:hypothetical protein